MKRKPPTNGYYALRWEVLERDNFTCQYCGQHAPNVKLEVDHVIPVEDGGKDEKDNLKTSCYACNRGRSGLRIIKTRRGKPYKNHVIVSPKTLRIDKIQMLLQSNPEGLTATQVAKHQDITLANAQMALSRAVKADKIQKVNKLYYPLTNQPLNTLLINKEESVCIVNSLLNN